MSLLGRGLTWDWQLKQVTRKMGKVWQASIVLLGHPAVSTENVARTRFSDEESKALHEAGVKTVHLQDVIHPHLHQQNLANIPSTATNPLYENAGRFTI